MQSALLAFCRKEQHCPVVGLDDMSVHIYRDDLLLNTFQLVHYSTLNATSEKTGFISRFCLQIYKNFIELFCLNHNFKLHFINECIVNGCTEGSN